MSANVDGMVREAIRAYRAGNKTEARQLLERATEIDSYNEQAWMWLSAVVETPEEQRICLENVLVINPDNQNAKMGLQTLAKTAPPPADDDMDMDDDDDAYNVPTSSISGSFNAASQYSKDALDDHFASMGLGASSKEVSFDDDPIDDPFASMFGDEPKSGSSFDDDDMFDDLRSHALADTNDEDNLFGYDDDEDDSFTNPSSLDGPFTSKTPSSGLGFTSDDDDDEDNFFDDDFGDEAAVFSTPSPSSPVPKAAPAASFSSKPTSGKASSAKSTLESDDLDPSHYFKMIPDSVKPTRAPGSKQGPSPVAWLGLVGLIVANLAAAALLVMNLSG